MCCVRHKVEVYLILINKTKREWWETLNRRYVVFCRYVGFKIVHVVRWGAGVTLHSRCVLIDFYIEKDINIHVIRSDKSLQIRHRFKLEFLLVHAQYYSEQYYGCTYCIWKVKENPANILCARGKGLGYYNIAIRV